MISCKLDGSVTVATQHCSTPPVSHEEGGRRITEERKEDSTTATPILIGDRFRRGEKRGWRFHLPVRARLSHPRAHPSPPNLRPARRGQLSSRESNPSGISGRPGADAPFGCARLGYGLGQPHKQAALQPNGTAGLLGHPHKHALCVMAGCLADYFPCSTSCVAVVAYMISAFLIFHQCVFDIKFLTMTL